MFWDKTSSCPIGWCPGEHRTKRFAMDRWLGAHVSASGGCFNAVENARSQLGPQAQSFAFFIRPRLTWRPVPPLSADAIHRFHTALDDASFSITNVVVHGSYLINLGSHDQELRRKSIELMVEEVLKCEQLGIELYVFHPGAATGHASVGRKRQKSTKSTAKKKRTRRQGINDDEDESTTDETIEENTQARDQARAESMQFIAHGIVEVLSRTTTTSLVLENTCGHGNALGRTFIELRQLLDASVEACPIEHHAASRLGVCLDTCHAFASGYAMESSAVCETMMNTFDAAMGATWLTRNVLRVVHVNDSKDPMGSRRDRHANIGRGTMGMAVFQWFMTSDRFTRLPMILETPRTKTKVKKTNQRRHEISENETLPTAQEEIAMLLQLRG